VQPHPDINGFVAGVVGDDFTLDLDDVEQWLRQ
jgi:hypothetical protein